MLFNPAMSLALPLAQIYAWRLWAARLGKGPAKILLGCLYLAINALALSVVINWYWTSEPPPANPVAWNWFYRPILLWELGHLVWLAVCLIILLVSLPMKLSAHHRSKGLPSLFKAKSVHPPLFGLRSVLLLVILAVFGVGYLKRLSPPETERLEAAIPELPAELEGLTVALVSNVHYGRGSNWTEAAALFEQLRLYRPDILIFTGDLFDKNPDFGFDLAPLMRALSPPHGAYAIARGDDSISEIEAAEALARAGIDNLSNRRFPLAAIPLTLIGLSDPLEPEEAVNFNLAAGPVPPEGRLSLLVTNRPQPASALLGHGVKLYLTGPNPAPAWSFFGLLGSGAYDDLYGPGSPEGLHRVEDLTVFVGSSLFSPFPVRLGERPKIALLTLKAAAW